MLLTRNIIDINISANEWLSEYETLLLEIEVNIENEPDISIESCKSLLESIAKNILKRLDSTYSEKKASDTDVHVLLKNAKEKLLEKILDSEDDLIKRLISVVQRITELRNERGDISHGKTLPKKTRSSVQLAKTIKSFTDAFASYLLHLFLSIDLLYQEPLRYEENPDFNQFLDEINPMTGGLLYSKALFHQDLTSYEEELETYKSDLSSQ
ncbi:MAG: abortive infection family protein [Methylococcaceae bacterium]|jgi:hypothetical protein